MMKQYDSYKDSGVEWIGKIPSHWEVCRLKNYCSLSGRIGWNGLRSEEFQQESYAYLVTGQDFNKADIDWDSCYQIDKERYDEDPFIQLKNGDILITKDGTIGKIAKVSGLDKPACLNSGIFVMKQKKNVFAQDYLYWMLVSSLLKDYNTYTSSGTTILHLYQNVFEKMPMVVPLFDEQEAIANYLDKKCGEIDKAVATQEKRVELLKELRQNIITQAVTRGINPNAPLKDSGVEWIGEVPEHWKVCRIKNVLKQGADSIKIGPFGSSLTGKVGADLDYKVYGQWNIVGADFNAGTNTVNKETFDELSKSYKVISGDILVSMMGTIGKCAVIPEGIQEGIMDSHVVKIRLNDSIMIGSYFEYIYDKDKSNVIFNQLQKMKGGSIMDGLNSTIIKSLTILVPPLSEQQEIVSYIESQTARLDKSIEKAEYQIELLQELKQSIITEVVTGKRKVD